MVKETRKLSGESVSRLKQTIILVVSILALLLSWVALFCMGGIAAWSLAPYDTTPLADRPPRGTWQRDLSDFFQVPPGSVIPSLLSVGISIVLAIIALGRIPDSFNVRTQLMLSFALSNIVVVAAMFLGDFLVADLPLEIAPYPGYGWTLKFLAKDVLLLAFLFVLQACGIPRWLLARFPKEAAGKTA